MSYPASPFGTNAVPTDVEARLIRASMSAPQEELARLDALIATSTARRQSLCDYIAACDALLSPARRLPPEVVSEVFLACLPDEHNPSMSAQDAPLKLGHICRAWREIALSNPRLWSSVHIVYPLVVARDDGIELLLNWLELSGVLPLLISFVGDPKVADHPAAQFLITNLLATSDRWEYLELNGMGMGSILMERFLALAPPRLHSLATSELLTDSFGIAISPKPLFRGAALRAIALDSSHARDYFSDLPHTLPFAQLTHLTLTDTVPVNEDEYEKPGIRPRALCALLAHCRDLEYLSFRACYDDDEMDETFGIEPAPPFPRERVVLPHLHTFLMEPTPSLDEFHPPPIPILREFWAKLDLPALTHLRIDDGAIVDVSNYGPSFWEAASNRFPRLETLSAPSPDSRLFIAFPAIRHLHFHGAQTDGTTIFALSLLSPALLGANRNSLPIASSIQSVTFASAAAIPVSEIHTFLQRHGQAGVGSRLRRLAMHFSLPRDREDVGHAQKPLPVLAPPAGVEVKLTWDAARESDVGVPVGMDPRSGLELSVRRFVGI
ncbi:F-box domain-containing protein [Mycena kentingensis (nom. inval.)]|nr:F-box domain-containing protein [Mycena kentingensis (nom. inval.)]